MAVCLGHVETLKALMESEHIDLLKWNTEGTPPLHAAIATHHYPKVITALLEAKDLKKLLQSTCKYGKTPLGQAKRSEQGAQSKRPVRVRQSEGPTREEIRELIEKLLKREGLEPILEVVKKSADSSN